MDQTALIVVIDDDQSVRESLPELIRECGYSSHAYPSAEEFLVSDTLGHVHCLILDVAMPGMTGTELQKELHRLQANVPIIFITAVQNEAVRASVLEMGAVACLLKPFGNQEILASIAYALQRTDSNRSAAARYL
jgi:FixJ family two-component response regulator